MMRGRITIDKNRCKGCEYCVIHCPRKCIDMSSDINKRGVHYAVFAKPSECTGCRICAQMCPDVCIEVFRKRGGKFYQQMEDKLLKIMDHLERLKPDEKKKPPVE